jgi:predicted transcriptional regulator
MRRFFGWFLVIFGLCGFGVEIDELLSGTADKPVLGFILASIFVIGGGALLRGPRRAAAPAGPVQAAVDQPAVLSPREVEQIVLACVKQHGGRVTIAEVAAETELTFTEAKKVLEELSRAGACTVDVTEQGAFIYEFTGLMPREPARQANNA